jgi:hypothetical protein
MFYTAQRIFNLEEFGANKNAITVPVMINMTAVKWIEPMQRVKREASASIDEYCIVYFIGGGELILFSHDIMRLSR